AMTLLTGTTLPPLYMGVVFDVTEVSAYDQGGSGVAFPSDIVYTLLYNKTVVDEKYDESSGRDPVASFFGSSSYYSGVSFSYQQAIDSAIMRALGAWGGIDLSLSAYPSVMLDNSILLEPSLVVIIYAFVFIIPFSGLLGHLVSSRQSVTALTLMGASPLLVYLTSAVFYSIVSVLGTCLSVCVCYLLEDPISLAAEPKLTFFYWSVLSLSLCLLAHALSIGLRSQFTALALSAGMCLAAVCAYVFYLSSSESAVFDPSLGAGTVANQVLSWVNPFRPFFRIFSIAMPYMSLSDTEDTGSTAEDDDLVEDTTEQAEASTLAFECLWDDCEGYQSELRLCFRQDTEALESLGLSVLSDVDAGSMTYEELMEEYSDVLCLYYVPPLADELKVMTRQLLFFTVVFCWGSLIPSDLGGLPVLFFLHPRFYRRDLDRKRYRAARQAGRNRTRRPRGQPDGADQNTPATDMSVCIRGLEVEFGGSVKALDGCSFSVESQSCVGLIGHNGAGKTTLFRALTGELISGRAKCRMKGGVDIAGVSAVCPFNRGLLRRTVAVSPQHDELLIPDLTVQDHVELAFRVGRRRTSGASRAAERLLPMLGLEAKALDTVKELSGGMKRRLSTGMAMVQGKRVTFLDEPSTGLDPLTRRTLWKALRGIIQSGGTVLFTTHNMDEIEVLCKHVVCMAYGRVVTDSTVGQLTLNSGQVFRVVCHSPKDAHTLKRLITASTPDAKILSQVAQCIHIYVPGDAEPGADVVAGILEGEIVQQIQMANGGEYKCIV
ncbi:hypothetical protein KIPB_010177, partial [Kipferlia bialata]